MRPWSASAPCRPVLSRLRVAERSHRKLRCQVRLNRTVRIARVKRRFLHTQPAHNSTQGPSHPAISVVAGWPRGADMVQFLA